MSGTSLAPRSITLHLQLAPHPLPHPGQTSTSPTTITTTTTNHTLTLPSTATIKEVKDTIVEWEGKPAREGVLLVLGGRVCREGDVVGDLFPVDAAQEGEGETTLPFRNVIHVIIKASAWTVPPASSPLPPSLTVPSSAPTVPSPALSRIPTRLPPTPSIALPEAEEGMESNHPGYRTRYLLPIPVASAEGTPPATLTSVPTPRISSKSLSSSGYPTYLAFVAQLIPLQRSLLLLNLQKAHYYYSLQVQQRLARLGWADLKEGSLIPDDELTVLGGESDEEFEIRRKEYYEVQVKEFEAGKGEDEFIQELLFDCGLWVSVEESDFQAVKELEEWGGKEKVDGASEFQVVQISGLPFLLHMPEGYTAPASLCPPPLHYRSLKRGQAILHILTTMLQLLITYQPTASAIAYARSPVRHANNERTGPREGAGAAGLGPAFDDIPLPERGHLQNALAAPVVGRAADAAIRPAARRTTVSIVINLEAMISILVPLVLLSLKVGFLLWIFGRNASKTKKLILFTLAALWIIWEGFTMQRRRAAGGRERLAERDRRRAGLLPAEAGAAANPLLARGAGEARPRAGGEGVPREGRAARDAVPGAPTPRVRVPISRWTPRYWLNVIAAVGLADEARELGLVPRSIAGRPVTNPPPQYVRVNPNDRIGMAQQARRRAIRTGLVAIVLFFGTLIPEVEKKRKRALEKRDRLLASRRASKMRRAAAAALNARVEAAGANVVAGGIPSGVDAIKESTSRRRAAYTAEGDANTTSDTPSASGSAGPSQNNVSGTPTPTNAAAGRAIVPDNELFADGLGEVDQTEGELLEEGDVVGGIIEEESDEEDRANGQLPRAEGDEVVAMF